MKPVLSNLFSQWFSRSWRMQTLVESERLFQLLVDGVTDYAIYMLDPSGVVSSWNTGAQRIKGFTAPEILRRRLLEREGFSRREFTR